MANGRDAALLLETCRNKATLYERLLGIAVEETELLERQPSGYLARVTKLINRACVVAGLLSELHAELDEWRPVVRLTREDNDALNRTLDGMIGTINALDRQQRRNLALLSEPLHSRRAAVRDSQPRAAVPHAERSERL